MKNNVTLVLSGGGARGFAHIGAIEEIESRGYKIGSIAGTSMGALVGGVYAVGKMNEYKEWVYNLDKQNIFKLLDFSFSNQGLIKGDKVLKTMKEFIPDTNIEDLKIKYTATAFDLAQNKEMVFSEGSLYNAIRASISIPTVFTPVISGDAVLVDGGVVNNIPINNAIRTNNDVLMAVYVNADIPVHHISLSDKEKRQAIYIQKINEFKKSLYKFNPSDQRKKIHYFNLMNDTIAAMTNQLATTIIKNSAPDILVEISKKSCGTYDFYKAEELVEIGRCAAREKLDSLMIISPD
ncbi:MAG TPA: patatin-like phospholipase family protein [Prolixibacteraceae bacterium]|nr:patatin-like phospholipase family protein [Prolixibacteraceae bacterium]